MTDWFKDVLECNECVFSKNGLRVDFCDKHALTPENLEVYLSSKQAKKPNKDVCKWSINPNSECQTTCKENYPTDYKKCKEFFSLP